MGRKVRNNLLAEQKRHPHWGARSSRKLLCTHLIGLPVNLFWSSVWQELKRCFSNMLTAGHAAVSLNTITQKPNECLHIYVSRYSRLHYAATNKFAWENTDTTRIYHFVVSINNSTIADKIAKQVWYAPRTLQDAFKWTLTLEAGLQLAKGVHLGRSTQVMHVSTSASCHHNGMWRVCTPSQC